MTREGVRRVDTEKSCNLVDEYKFLEIRCFVSLPNLALSLFFRFSPLVPTPTQPT